MPFTYIKVSPVSGNSLNSGFSLVYSNVPTVYHVAVQNNCSFVVCGSLGTTAPTSATVDQFFVPASGYAWWDAKAGENLAASGANFYLRTDETFLQSGVVRICFK